MPREEAFIRTAFEEVAEARHFLLSPCLKALRSSMLPLEHAVTCLKAVQAARPPDPAQRSRLLSGTLALRQSLCRVKALLDHAAAFHTGRSRRIAEATGGYTTSGEPATPKLRNTLSVEG
jgi:hypothetical protein